MRFLITLLYTVMVAGLLWLDQPEAVARLVQAVARATDKAVHEKEVWFSGNEIIDRRDLEPLLPLDRPNWWWTLYPDKVAASLRAHPLVLEARVDACSGAGLWHRFDAWWGCFRIHIRERHARLVALRGDRGWVVGEDGGVVTALPSKRVAEVKENGGPVELLDGPVPVVQGLLNSDDSPELAQARLAHAAQFCALVAERVGRQISKVEVLHEREVRVSFHDAPWTLRLGFGTEAEWRENLERQLARLSVVLGEMKGGGIAPFGAAPDSSGRQRDGQGDGQGDEQGGGFQEERLQEIDLGHPDIAVVRRDLEPVGKSALSR